MQHLKTNWHFNDLAPGFWFQLSLAFASLSFSFHLTQTWLQKTICGVIFGIILIWQLLKIDRGQVLIITLLLIFSVLLWRQTQQLIIEPREHVPILLYPDEITIDEGYLTGHGHIDRQTVLLSGKIDSAGSMLWHDGKPFVLNATIKQEKIASPTNYGQTDFKQIYASQGIFWRESFQNGKALPVTLNVIGYAHLIREKFRKFLVKLPRPLSFFANELFLATGDGQDNQTMNHYRDLGIIHLLSISGLHVTLICNFISLSFSIFHRPTEKAFGLIMLILALGLFLSGFQPGFVRASLAFILQRFFSMKKWMVNKADRLGITLMIHLSQNPLLLMSRGAVLTYLLALGLLLTEHMSNLKQSFGLNLIIMPLLLHYFYQINPLTIIFNLFAIPYFNFILLPSVLLSAATFLFLPGLSFLLAGFLRFTEQILTLIAENRLGLVTFGKLSGWQASLLLAVTLFWIAQGGLNIKEKNKKIKTSLVLMYFIFFSWIHFPLVGQVIFIDVGQGDSILITTPLKRQVYLIDTGGKLQFSKHKAQPQINQVTLPLLHALGISQIDGLFLSHQDADHVGDLSPLLDQIKVKNLYFAKGLTENDSIKRRLLGHLHGTRLQPLLAGDRVDSKIKFDILFPDHAVLGKNEDSLSLTFELNHRRWLFTGDLDRNGEKKIMATYPLKADYFKLGHHGSKTASDPLFLKQLNPRMVFISVGRNNRFGHPNPETLQTLKVLNIPKRDTAHYGMITWNYSIFGMEWLKTFCKGDSE